LGNSCRGIKGCVDLANELGLHTFDCMNIGSSYLQAMLDCCEKNNTPD